MPQTFFEPTRKSSKLFTIFGLMLGVCFFLMWTPTAFALDSNSPLFDQTPVSSAGGSSSRPPMALPEESPNPSPGLFPTLARLVFALVVTLGLIFLTVWGLKWVWEKKGWNQWTEEGKAIRVLASTYLSPRKTIHLVEVGKRILVVGVGGEEMTCLDVIREPEEVEVLRGATQQGFSKIFNRTMQRHDAADRQAETKRIFEESSKAVGGYVAKLKNMKKKNASEQTDGDQ